ncbi:MAG: UTP--glucose-1-phosphate uridylyltransferase [Candidatus Dojkabacteria bacterium]
MKQVKKAVITAAGFGSRFLPVVKSTPKEMLPVVDKPILQYVVEECIDAGMEEIIIVVRKGNNVIRNYFFEELHVAKQLLNQQGKDERYHAVQEVLNFKGITIVDQDPDLPYGNGSPVITVKDKLEGEEAFAVLFADDLVLTKGDGAMKQVVDFYRASDDIEGVLGAQKVRVDEVDRYGIVKPVDGSEKEDHGQVELVVEKPDIGSHPSTYALYGRFIVPGRIFDFLKDDATGKDDEVCLADAIDKVAKSGKFMYKLIDGQWYTTGDPVRYFEAQAKFMLADERYGDKTRNIVDSL